MKISYLVWFLLLSVVSWQDFQKQEISSWLLILMGSLGTGIQIFEGSVSLGAWFGGILLGAALVGGCLLIFRKVRRNYRLPFAPFLLVGSVLSLALCGG